VVFQQQAAGASVSSLPGQDSTTVVTSFIKPAGQVAPLLFAALSDKCTDLEQRLQHNVPVSNLPAEERAIVRTDLYLLAKSIRKLQRLGYLRDPGSRQLSATLRQHSEQLTNFIPDWVKAAVALALGLGTMIGYRRIVITVGERIGKEHLSYAQGGAAELVTMSTILLADHFGAPVSTTHVLSSGIAGTMAANNSGLQVQTLRNILMAWVLTLPACIFLGALTFAFSINVIALLGIT
jgi:PiT family inorganic phosphate transporter